MRTIQRNLFALVLIACLALSGVAVRAQVPSPTPQPSATPIPITVNVWHSLTSTAAADLLAKWAGEFQTREPNVTIVFRALDPFTYESDVLDAIRRDQGPDLFLGRSGWAADLAEARRITPLNARIGDDFRAQVIAPAWETVTLRDVIYGVPIELFTTVLFVNIPALGAEPIPPTVDALFARTPDMMFDFYTTAGLYFGNGGTLFDAQGQLTLAANADLFRAYVTRLSTLYKQYQAEKLLNREAPPVSTDFRFRGAQTPFLVDGNLKALDFVGLLSGSVRTETLPPVAEGKPWRAFNTSNALYLNINANQSDAAMRFARYTTTEAAQTVSGYQFGRIPVHPKAAILPGTVTLQTQAANGLPVPPYPAMKPLWALLDQAVFGVTVLGLPPEQVVQETLAALPTLVIGPTATVLP